MFNPSTAPYSVLSVRQHETVENTLDLELFQLKSCLYHYSCVTWAFRPSVFRFFHLYDKVITTLYVNDTFMIDYNDTFFMIIYMNLRIY